MSRCALFTDDLFLEHDTGPGHPETAARLTSIRGKLEQTGYYADFAALEPRFATADEIALNHDPAYVKQLAAVCKRGGGYLDGDTVAAPRSFEAASLAAGAGIEAADRILAGDIDSALLLLRPPGHHSLYERAMGFCLFNNVAICAQYLRRQGLERVAIVDFDVHHGNGTEASFYEDPSVLFISTHQYPFYPGTGASEDTGTGAGLGTTLNVPMASGSGDSEYHRAFSETIIPRLEEFAPQALLISAGFDGHTRDPLASIDLNTASYEWMTRELSELARQSCNGKVISFLEGGYNLDALADSVEAHAAVLK